MLKQGTFISKQFNKLLIGGVWGSLAYAVNMMADSIISGAQLGEVALQAVSIVFPLFSVVNFVAFLAPMGISVIFGKSIGEFKEEEAHRAAGTGLIFSIIIGILLSTTLWIIKMPFLNYYECTGELMQQASDYYNWLIVLALIDPLFDIIYYLVITDGETVLYTIASSVSIITNVVLSIVLARFFGVAGLGMASFFGQILYSIIFTLHFFKKKNSIKFHLCVDFKILKKAIVLSSSEYVYYLFVAIVDIVMNKIIISSCGMEYIPAYSVVNLVFGVCEVFNSINNSSMGFVTCFLGERNNHDMHFIYRKISLATLAMAICLTLFFFFGAPLMPIIYGLENPTTVSAAVFASRVMAFTSLGFGFNYLGGANSSYVEKPGQACFISFLNDVFSPLLLSLIFGRLWGFTGIAIGMSLSTYLACGIYSLVQVPRKGKKGYPIYVEDFGEEGYSYDLYVTPENLVELRDAVSKELTEHGYEIKNIDLLIEEFFTRIMEKNPGKKVMAECTLLFGEDKVRVIIRDDGELFNYVDEDNKTESLNAYVLNCILKNTKQKNYILTTSTNRNGFVFDKLINKDTFAGA